MYCNPNATAQTPFTGPTIKKEKRKLFEKIYDDEALYDLERDVSEAVSEDYVKGIPKDKHGFRKGTFRVTIVWEE